MKISFDATANFAATYDMDSVLVNVDVTNGKVTIETVEVGFDEEEDGDFAYEVDFDDEEEDEVKEDETVKEETDEGLIPESFNGFLRILNEEPTFAKFACSTTASTEDNSKVETKEEEKVSVKEKDEADNIAELISKIDKDGTIATVLADILEKTKGDSLTAVDKMVAKVADIVTKMVDSVEHFKLL